ncbi:MAG: GNAT family N-acetyltransferase [Candidatus Saganbacteria bacterium]|nr:GNAT family N-acetyltransferase [Candidatus Saganbacteria bacterium]
MLRILPLKTDDIAKVVEIESASFSAPKDETIFRDDQNKYLVAKENDEIVGYIGVEKISGETHIINMAVKEGVRRRGIGTKLVEAVLNDRDVFS